MKRYLVLLIAFFWVVSCGSQRTENFSDFNGENARNTFVKKKIVPGLQGQKSFHQYTITLEPSLASHYEVWDANGRVIPSHITMLEKYPEVALIRFTDSNINFEDEGMILMLYTGGKNSKRVLLPKPEDKGEVYRP